eukprot:CAMPEP_0183709892 /NCGR_PEP_ID=MMETSP0737-20130205/5841_1 /TAXON_ID=385413 /ORGANISM="Thalassiosira miniscula, Strain CCMP1093" /LENGTH=389 /DNA_ID=CAMNT_0025938107 /DNA_START=139 /DNA_END=1308 /DNA_ORIENTATION=-
MNYLQKVLAVAVAFAASCHSFNANTYPSLSARNRAGSGGGRKNAYTTSASSPAHPRTLTRGGSQLYLFDSLLQKQGGQPRSRYTNGGGSSSSLRRISEEELNFLSSGFGLEINDTPPFPYLIGSVGKDNQGRRLVVRHLEDEDITKILPEVVREFGALIAPSNAPKQPGDELADKIENYLFSLTVLIGLTQRVVRREKGYSEASGACPDHNVICLVEQIANDENINEKTTYTENIVGMAELSWQPPNPNSNAPPFVLPYFVKTLISRFGPSRDGTTSSKEGAPKGYISNVLVWKTRRGRGYARVLMAALEGIANMWGCDDIRLHVDASEYSGRIARGLYWDLGYEGVPDRGTSKKNQVGYDWMGPNMANQGLYLVDGVPLLYLRKSLRE